MLNLLTGEVTEDKNKRILVYYDIPLFDNGPIVTQFSPRNEYMQQMAEEGDDCKEPVARGRKAVVMLFVPAHARVTVDGDPTRTKGRVRSFLSPSLPRGKTLYYTVKVVWKEGDHLCAEIRKVWVRPGEVVRAYFMLPIQVPPTKQE